MAVWKAIGEGFEVHRKTGERAKDWEPVEILQGGDASLGEIKLLEWRQRKPGETFRLVRRNSWVLNESIKIK